MSSTRRRLASIFAVLALARTTALAAELASSPPVYDLLNPRPGQFEINLENMSGFIGSGSIVRVREFQIEGTGLHFPALGINTVQLPDADFTYWFNQLSAINFQFRYFDVGGSHYFAQPVRYNGATIASGQTLNTDPWEWFGFYLYYERRLTPLFENYEAGWPEAFQHWDLRGRLGVDYTYLNFGIDNGHAPVTKASKGEETIEDFYRQELPIPTIGLEALHSLGENLTFQTSVKATGSTDGTRCATRAGPCGCRRTEWKLTSGCCTRTLGSAGSIRCLASPFTTTASWKTRTKTATSSAGSPMGLNTVSSVNFNYRS